MLIAVWNPVISCWLNEQMSKNSSVIQSLPGQFWVLPVVGSVPSWRDKCLRTSDIKDPGILMFILDVYHQEHNYLMLRNASLHGMSSINTGLLVICVFLVWNQKTQSLISSTFAAREAKLTKGLSLSGSYVRWHLWNAILWESEHTVGWKSFRLFY